MFALDIELNLIINQREWKVSWDAPFARPPCLPLPRLGGSSHFGENKILFPKGLTFPSQASQRGPGLPVEVIFGKLRNKAKRYILLPAFPAPSDAPPHSQVSTSLSPRAVLQRPGGKGSVRGRKGERE